MNGKNRKYNPFKKAVRVTPPLRYGPAPKNVTSRASGNRKLLTICNRYFLRVTRLTWFRKGAEREEEAGAALNRWVNPNLGHATHSLMVAAMIYN